MNTKEKHLAEIEARLASFGSTIEEISQKAKSRNDARPDIDLESLEQKHQQVHETVKTIKSSNSGDWDKVKSTIDQMMGDIDQDLRSAISYFG